MPNYSQHRMNNYDWLSEYKKKMGKEAFCKYVDGVYRFLIEMKQYTFFSIEKNVKTESRDLFIKICCMFIHEGNSEYVMSEQYDKIIRKHG